MDFCKEAARIYPGDASKRVSRAHFFRILRKRMPYVRVRVGGEFMKCDTCVTLKERRYGAPGVKPTLDSVTLKTIEEELSAHRKVGLKCRNRLTILDLRRGRRRCPPFGANQCWRSFFCQQQHEQQLWLYRRANCHS